MNQMKNPHILHCEDQLIFHSVPPHLPANRSFTYVKSGARPQQVAFPAEAWAVEKMLSSSNFSLSEGMMLGVCDLVFGGTNSLCPTGNHYKLTDNTARIRTVSPQGAVWEITVSQKKEKDWKVDIQRKSGDDKYPMLVEIF